MNILVYVVSCWFTIPESKVSKVSKINLYIAPVKPASEGVGVFSGESKDKN